MSLVAEKTTTEPSKQNAYILEERLHNLLEQLEWINGWTQRPEDPSTHSFNPKNTEKGKAIKLRNTPEVELFNMYYLLAMKNDQIVDGVYNEVKRYGDDAFAFRFFLDFDLAVNKIHSELVLTDLVEALDELAVWVAKLHGLERLDYVLTTSNEFDWEMDRMEAKTKKEHECYYGVHMIFSDVMVCVRDQDAYLFNAVYTYMREKWPTMHGNLTRKLLANSLDFTTSLAMPNMRHHMPFFSSINGLVYPDCEDVTRCFLFRNNTNWTPLPIDIKLQQENLRSWQVCKDHYCHDKTYQICMGSENGVLPSTLDNLKTLTGIKDRTKFVRDLMEDMTRLFELQHKFRITSIKHHMMEVFVIYTDSKECLHIGRKHASNHVYFVINRTGVYQKCLDSECAKYKSPTHTLSSDVYKTLFIPAEMADAEANDPDGNTTTSSIPESDSGNKPKRKERAITPNLSCVNPVTKKKYKHSLWYYQFLK